MGISLPTSRNFGLLLFMGDITYGFLTINGLTNMNPLLGFNGTISGKPGFRSTMGHSPGEIVTTRRHHAKSEIGSPANFLSFPNARMIASFPDIQPIRYSVRPFKNFFNIFAKLDICTAIIVAINIKRFTEFATIFNHSAFKQLTMILTDGIGNLTIIKGPGSNNTFVEICLNQAGTGQNKKSNKANPSR